MNNNYFTLYVKGSKFPYCKSGLILTCCSSDEEEAKQTITFILGENWPENYELRPTSLIVTTTLDPITPELNEK